MNMGLTRYHMTHPNIEVIAQFYNDEFLAPFFMRHYSFADKIRCIIDLDTTDHTENIVSQYSNATLEYFKFPNLYEDELLTGNLNKAYAESEADWVIVVSPDEFVFIGDANHYFANQECDVIPVRFFQVYRNIDDDDLDPIVPVQLLRRYGDPDVVKGQNKHGTKPIVAKTGKKIKWMPGGHGVWNPHRFTFSPNKLIGAHWHMADPCFCIHRRLERQVRMSSSDIAKGHGSHNVGNTEQSLLDECNEHLYDKQVF